MECILIDYSKREKHNVLEAITPLAMEELDYKKTKPSKYNVLLFPFLFNLHNRSTVCMFFILYIN